MQAQFLNSPFLNASQEYCAYFLFAPFLVSSAVISSYFLRQSLLFSSPSCGRCHSQDEFSLPVLSHLCHHVCLCDTCFPYYQVRYSRISQLYRYLCCTYRPYRQEAISCSHVQPHIYLVVSYHREHDDIIDRFLATPFLIVLLLCSFERNFLRLISYFFKNLRLNSLQS